MDNHLSGGADPGGHSDWRDGVKQRFALATNEGTSKLMPLDEAIRRFVRPGSMVHAAYADSRPNAALFGLVRSFAGTDAGLTLVTAGLVNAQVALVETGVVTRLIASFAGENFPVARPNPAFQRAVAAGRVRIQNWSLWSLTARLMAGALGLPYIPTRSLHGTDLAEENRGDGYLSLPAVQGAPETGAVTALNPDVVLFQGVAADQHGNVISSAPYGESYWGALAAQQGVIACVEQVVDTGAIRDHGHLVTIPAHRVLAVCQTPFGSHPYGSYSPSSTGVRSYLEDEEFITEAFEASRDPSTFRRWIQEWITEVGSHQGYLEKLGNARLTGLSDRAEPDSWQSELEPSWQEREGDPTRQELVVVSAARRLMSRVAAEGFETVLAGVGLSNLAAWLAVSRLKRTGADIELMSEIGMYGYDPRPGDPFIFSKRNVPTCKMLTDVAGVLGGMVGGPSTSCIGLVGAGQVDSAGNLNSTYLPDGTFLVGSGGANDIASTADELLVTIDHRPGRLVEHLPYRTCPGRAVRTIVTTLGVLERRGTRFELVSYLDGSGTDARDAVDRIRSSTEWEFDVSNELAPEAAPEPDELSAIRLFDPDRRFLR